MCIYGHFCKETLLPCRTICLLLVAQVKDKLSDEARAINWDADSQGASHRELLRTRLGAISRKVTLELDAARKRFACANTQSVQSP